MRRLTEEALRAGAFGFTTSRTYSHKTKTGEMVPGHFAEEQELFGIGPALGAAGAGAFGMNSDFDDEARELAWMTRLSKETGRPVWFLLTDRPTDPERWRRLMAGRPPGARARAPALPRRSPAGRSASSWAIDTSMNPFSIRPSYSPLDSSAAGGALDAAARPRGARRHPRRAAVRAPSSRGCRRCVSIWSARWDRMFVMGRRPITSRRRRRASPRSPRAAIRSPQEVAYDYLTERPDHFLFFPIVGYVRRRPRARSARC